MTRATRTLLRLGAVMLVAAVAFGGTAAAEDKSPAYEPRVAHAEADTNDDGRVDREEFHHRMVEIFFHGDRDKDGFMTFAELEKALLFPDDFKIADANKDGRISLYEFVGVRFYDFDAADTNEDGFLSVEEVVVVFEGKSS